MADYDKTATLSGTVATFFDGSDEVPCKSLNVSLPASLEGYESIDIHRNGKNLIDITTLVDGYVTTTGTFSTSHTQDEMRSDFIRVEPNTRYTFRIITTTGTYAAWVGIGQYSEDNVESFVSRSGQDFTTSATTHYVVVSARNLKTATQIQLEQGDKNTGYEAFEDTKFTIPFGRTIYGAQADVVNGAGSSTHAKITFTGADTENWQYSTSGSHYRVFITLPNAKTGTNTFASNLITPAPSAAGYPGIGTGWINNNGNIVIGVDSDITSVTDWKDYLNNNNMVIVYELADEYKTDFTFTGQDVSTRLLANSFYVDLEGSYNMDMTYYLNGFGYPAVTVNRAMCKNLFKFLCYFGSTYNPSVGAQWTMKVNNAQWNDNGDGSFWLKPAGKYYVYSFLIPVRYGTEYNLSFLFTSTGEGQVTCGFLTRSYKVLSVERILNVPLDFNRNIDPPQDAGFYYLVFNNGNTSNVTITVTNPQMEFGRSKTTYEPYVEPVSQTVKFHKIIYGGEVDVIKGTAKPKNLLKNLGTFPYTISASEQYYSEFTNNINARKIPLFALENNVTYTLSLDVQCSNEPFYISVGVGDGRYLRDLSSSASGTSGRLSITFTPTGLTEGNNYLAFRAPRYGSKKDYDVTVDNVQLEKASTASDFAPYFDPFTFTPVNFNTVEGENTLYAGEGDSVITYRKDTE